MPSSSATSFDPPFPDTGTHARPLNQPMPVSLNTPSAYTRFRRADPFANRAPRRVPGEGPQPCQLMLIGEKPGEKEARSAIPRPFIGPAGQYLDICLAAANIDRKFVYITNLTKEFTSYSKPTREEIERDHDELVAEILLCDPEVIGLVGGWAVEHVLGVTHAEMERVHGVPRRVDALFAGELVRDRPWIVIPLLHPAGATHSPDSLPLILDDMLQLGRLLDHEIAVREDDPYAGKEDYRDYPQSSRTVIITKPAGCDTEGSAAKPWCMTASTRPGTGRLFKPGQRVKFKNKVYLWNALHDLGVLRNMGIELEDDQYVDLMIYSYLLCVAPQGLKPSAYRNCGMLQDDYDDIVHDARVQKATDYLLAAADCDWPKAEPQIIEEGGAQRVYKPRSVNFRINKIMSDWTKWQIGEREEEVNLRKRWNDIDDIIKAPVIEAMGDMPDATLDDVPYKRAQRYAIRDADATLRMAPILEQKIRDMGLDRIAAIDHAILPMLNSMQYNGIRLAPTEFWDNIERQCETQMQHAKFAIWKATGEDINPASGDQVAELLYGKLGLTPPKLTDSGERGSVNAVCLEALLADNPVVQHVLDYTEASKIRGTYVYPLRKLCTVGDCRVRSTIRSTRTTTGRLAMADPPLHQIPIMTDLGKQLRGGFIAEEGNILYDIDVDQLEMRIMAHDSKDEELCRLFHENRDIHSETACSIFSVPMSALSVGPMGKVNDYRRIVAKHAAFGIINGITEHGLVNYMILNRCRRPDGEPWTVDDCLMMREAWFQKYKGVRRFHNECMEETRQTGLARETIGGRIIYLPQIWSPNKKVRETAERMSYVMHTQGGGQSLIKRSMAVMWREVCKRLREVRALLQMHDELLFEIQDREQLKQEIDRLCVRAFCETVQLRVPVKASGGFGPDWLHAH